MLPSLDDGGNAIDSSASGCTTVNDGNTHQVVVVRQSGSLSVYVDGLYDAGPSASSASFGTLPALATGTDVCVGVNGDGTVALDTTQGSLTDVCISTSAQAQAGAGTSSCN